MDQFQDALNPNSPVNFSPAIGHPQAGGEESIAGTSMSMSPILENIPETFVGQMGQYSPLLYRSENSSIGPGTPFSIPESVPETPAMSNASISSAFPPVLIKPPTSIRYIFPAPQPHPIPRTEPMFITTTSKTFTKAQVCQEFVAVETDNQKLRYDVNVLQQENSVLKDHLVKWESYHSEIYQQILTRISELERVQGDQHQVKEDEGEQDDELMEIGDDEEVLIKVEDNVLTSEEASNNNKIKVQHCKNFEPLLICSTETCYNPL